MQKRKALICLFSNAKTQKSLVTTFIIRGAGFGGCAIALIRAKEFPQFKRKVESLYYQKTGINPEVFQVDIVDGPTKINRLLNV